MSSCVDVIVPCYQYGHFLCDCVESILSQENVEVRVLIIDDASTDNSPDVAAALVRKDPRVTFRRHLENRGNIATFNEGLDWASADYTLLISADDMLIPGALARACRLLDSYPCVGMVYGRVIPYRMPNPLPAPREVIEPVPWHIYIGYEWIERVVTDIYVGVTSPEAVVRTQVQHQLGGYRQDLPRSADTEMWIRFALNGSIGFIDADQAYYRLHDRNMHYQLGHTSLNYLKDRAAAFHVAFTYSSGRDGEQEQRLDTLARRTIAELALWEGSAAFDRGDNITCHEYLDFALSIFPVLQSSRSWSRLQWKRSVGPHFWSVLRPVVNGARKLSHRGLIRV